MAGLFTLDLISREMQLGNGKQRKYYFGELAAAVGKVRG